MKKLSPKILLTTCLGVIVILISLFFILENLIKNQLVNYAEEFLNREVSVSKVKIYLLGDTIIENIKVKNKQEFSQQNILEINKIILRVNFVSLLKNVARIDKLIIDKPKVFIEINKALKPNFEFLMGIYKTNNTILKNPNNKQIDSKRIILRDASITDAKVHLKSPLLSMEKIISIPDIKFTNIGLKEKGIPLRELNEQLLRVSYTKLKTIATENTELYKNKVRTELEKKLSHKKEKLKKSLGKMKENIEKNFSKQMLNY